jgi:hypothetical protein
MGDQASRRRVFLSLIAASAGSAMQLVFWLFAFAFCKDAEFGRLNIAWAAGYGLGQFLTLNEHRQLIDHPELFRQLLVTLGCRLGLAILLILIASVFFLDPIDWKYVLLTMVLAAQYLLQLPSQSMAVGSGRVRFELLFRLLGPLTLLVFCLPTIAVFGMSFVPVVIGVVVGTVVVMLGLIFHLYSHFLQRAGLQVQPRVVGAVKGIYLFHVAMDASLYPAVFFLLSKSQTVRETELWLRLLITVSGVVVSALAMHAYKFRTHPLMRTLSMRAAWLGVLMWLIWALYSLIEEAQLGPSGAMVLWISILVWQLILSLVGVLSLLIVDTRGQNWFSVRAISHHALVASVALWVYWKGLDLTQSVVCALLWLMSGILLTMVWPSAKKGCNEF